MCRAISVLVVAPSEEACRRLRVLAGAEVQVVAEATSAADVADGLDGLQLDVVVLDARVPDASSVLVTLVRERPGTPIVWIGESAPPGTKVTVSPERVVDDLPRAIVRAVAQRD